MRFSQWQVGRPPAGVWNHICLWPLILLSASFWISPLPQGQRFFLNFLGTVEEKRVSPSASHTTGKARYSFSVSLSPVGESTTSAPYCATLVEEQSWRSSFYPLQCSQVHILLLLFNRVLESLLKKPGLLQMLFYLWAFVQVRALQPPQWKETKACLQAPASSTASIEVCLSPDAQVPWHTVLDSTTPIETLSFMGKCQILVVKKRRKWRMSNIVIMLIFKSSFSCWNLSKIGLWLLIHCTFIYLTVGGASGKEPACQCSSLKRWGFHP